MKKGMWWEFKDVTVRLILGFSASIIFYIAIVFELKNTLEATKGICDNYIDRPPR